MQYKVSSNCNVKQGISRSKYPDVFVEDITALQDNLTEVDPMQKETLLFTAGQFARLHHLNRRTLHYYDEIGLFSPACKGENGYRYYTYQQSVTLENILSLRELGMSIEEVKAYVQSPDPASFKEIAAQKTLEIEEQIRHLKVLKTLLKEKQDALDLCGQVYDGKIETVNFKERYFLLTPFTDQGEM